MLRISRQSLYITFFTSTVAKTGTNRKARRTGRHALSSLLHNHPERPENQLDVIPESLETSGRCGCNVLKVELDLVLHNDFDILCLGVGGLLQQFVLIAIADLCNRYLAALVRSTLIERNLKIRKSTQLMFI